MAGIYRQGVCCPREDAHVMTTTYGIETDIAFPTLNIQIETIRSIRASELKTSFQRITQNHKVNTIEDEMRVFTDFSGLLQKYKRSGRLLYKHADPSMLPAIVIKYPRDDSDNSWFVITTYTIVML